MVDLNDFEKVHSGGSSDSYILLSLAYPNLYMGVKREDFFKSLLSKRTDDSELLFSARALVAQMKEEQVTSLEGPGPVTGIDVEKPPKMAPTDEFATLAQVSQPFRAPPTPLSSADSHRPTTGTVL